MKLLAAIALILLCSTIASAQPTTRSDTDHFGIIEDAVALGDNSMVLRTFQEVDLVNCYAITKILADGTIAWRAMADPIYSENFIAMAVTRSSDIIVLGTLFTSATDAILARIGPDGTIKKTVVLYSETGWVNVKIVESPDGSITLASTSGSLAHKEGFVARFDSSLNLKWARDLLPDNKHFTQLFPVAAADGSIKIFLPYQYEEFVNSIAELTITADGNLASQYFHHTGIEIFDGRMALQHPNGAFYYYGNLGGITIRPVLARFSGNGTMDFLKTIEIPGTAAARYMSVSDDGSLLLSATNINIRSYHMMSMSPEGDLLRLSGSVGLSDSQRNYQAVTLKLSSGKNVCLFPHDTTSPYDDYDYYLSMTSLDASLTGCQLSSALATTTSFPDTVSSESHYTFTYRFMSCDNYSGWTFRKRSMNFHIDPCELSDVADERSQPPSAIVTISPNPIANAAALTIKASAIPTGYYRCTLRDITGKIVYSITQQFTSGEELHIPSTGIASGIYIAELCDASTFTSAWRAKVIIE